MEEKDYGMFIKEIEAKFNDFLFNAAKGEKNKTAALMARKDAMIIRKILKEFRLISVKNDKR